MRQNSQFATSWIFQAGSCFQGFNFSTSQNTETKNMSMVSWNKSICDALESMELGQKPLTKSKLPSLELWDCFEKHTQGLWAAVPNPTMQILTVFLLDLYSPLPTVIHIGIRGWGQSTHVFAYQWRYTEERKHLWCCKHVDVSVCAWLLLGKPSYSSLYFP